MGTGTGIGRVRGLGSAKHGAKHWLNQRLTAVGNIVLVLWLIFSLLSLSSLEYGAVVAWLSSPIVAVPMMLMIVSIFWHLKMGMQTMLEDYIHEEGMKLIAMLLLNFYAIGGAAFGLFAIAKIAFMGAAG